MSTDIAKKAERFAVLVGCWEWNTSTHCKWGHVGVNMICIKTEIPQEICDIDDELKAIYHSNETVCFFIFKTRNDRNEFIEKTKGMKKTEREKIYQEYSR